MSKLYLAVLGFFLTLTAAAHVTPSVTLARRGDFIRQALPGATKFFEKTLGAAAVASVREATGWTPSPEEAKVYVGRDQAGNLVGTAVFLWVASQHGPVGLGVAFGPEGGVLEATVTNIGTEPLVWVRPLLRDGRLTGLAARGASASPDASSIAPEATGAMTRYYARVITAGIARAQAIQKASGEVARR